MGEIQKGIFGEIVDRMKASGAEVTFPDHRKADIRRVLENNGVLTGKDSTHFNVADAHLLRQVRDFGHPESVNYQSERAQDVSIAPDGTRTVTHRVTTKLATTHYDEQAPIVLKTGLTDAQKAAFVPISIVVGVLLFGLIFGLILALANTPHP